MTRRALSLTALLLVSACARTPEGSGSRGASVTPADNAPVAIGVGVLPAHPRYTEIVEGVRFAVDRLNEGKGRRFLVRLPPAGVANDVALAEALRDDPEVIGVVGGADNAAVFATLGTYADTAEAGARALPLVSPAAAASRLSGVNAWFFRVTPNDKDVARFAARWVRDSLPARRAVVVYRNDAVGRDWSNTFADAFGRSGGVVIVRRPYLAGITEWEAYAHLMRKLAPEVILFAGDGEDLAGFQRALRDQGIPIPVVGSADAAPEEGADLVAGMRYVAVRGSVTNEGRAFLQRYQERRRRAPVTVTTLAYDAAIVLGRSVQRGAGTRALLRDALERTGNGAPSVQGALGLIAFRYDHDIRGRTVAVAAVTAPGAP